MDAGDVGMGLTRETGQAKVIGNMMRLALVGCVLPLVSCAGGTRPSVAQPLGAKAYARLMAEVGSGGPDLKRSLPELKYATSLLGMPVAMPVATRSGLRDADGRSFQVLVLHRPANTYPGTDFALAYLRNPEGKIVDWVSRWSYSRLGTLKTRLLDVNDDGLKEFCFVRRGRFGRHDQLLAAYVLDEGKFRAVIPDETCTFRVTFKETTSNGLLISPQLKGDYGLPQDKLIEVPVRITNTSSTSKNLRHGLVEILSTGEFLSMGFGGMCIPGRIEEGVLHPDESVDTTVTILIRSDARKRTIGFKLSSY